MSNLQPEEHEMNDNIGPSHAMTPIEPIWRPEPKIMPPLNAKSTEPDHARRLLDECNIVPTTLNLERANVLVGLVERAMPDGDSDERIKKVAVNQLITVLQDLFERRFV